MRLNGYGDLPGDARANVGPRVRKDGLRVSSAGCGDRIRLCCFSDTYWNCELGDGSKGNVGCEAVSNDDGGYDDDDAEVRGSVTKPPGAPDEVSMARIFCLEFFCFQCSDGSPSSEERHRDGYGADRKHDLLTCLCPVSLASAVGNETLI